MKGQNVVLTLSVLAVNDLQARRFVGLDGKTCGDGAKALGVVEVDTEADSMAPANALGAILVEAGGAIAAGADVQSNASGQVVAKAAGLSNGIALDAATATGDVIRILRGI
ncbi:putative membrane protein [Chromobacterium vaccinii]|nr:putative membrane protein [Chromobacterium vaccinii]QND89404.1 putative membrane protein [Chromobacterium vaccinii]